MQENRKISGILTTGMKIDKIITETKKQRILFLGFAYSKGGK